MTPTISVRTTQNVYIQYPLGSLGDRILAFLIDAVILTGYLILAWWVLDKLKVYSEWIRICAFTIPYLLYHLIFEILMNGQSPGKRIMRIKVVRLDGSSPTIGNYLLRWLFRLVEVFVLRGALAMVAIASSEKGQRLGDVVAGTAVVKLPRDEQSSAQSVFTLVEEDYVPTFPQVVNLSDRDVEMIQQALEVNRQTGNIKPAMAIVEKLNNLFGVASDLPPLKLLYTIIKDYSTLTAGK